jgi:glycosyltransferase involved in cell wall biosynthesis
MNIAIIGTRGIPNHYGGFEQFAEYVSLGLVRRGYRVTVYNSHNHPYQESSWNGVHIIHCNDPEHKIGTAGQFIYDLNCIRDTRKRNFDIILQLGYTSSSIWGRLLPRHKSIVTTNMDGLEWKRTKYSAKVQRFLQYAEKLAVRHSDYLIADSIGIQNYLQEKYQMPSAYIPYGAHLFHSPEVGLIQPYELKPLEYDMLIARLEPENSIETILDGVAQSTTARPFVVIGKHETSFGNYLKDKYRGDARIKFLGGIYDIHVLNNLRHFSNLYFHGHTVGGTNPSLLEAMASQSLICAHDNIFNKAILGDDAFYFQTNDQVTYLLQNELKRKHAAKIIRNEAKIEELYSWDKITDQYIQHFEEILANKN